MRPSDAPRRFDAFPRPLPTTRMHGADVFDFGRDDGSGPFECHAALGAAAWRGRANIRMHRVSEGAARCGRGCRSPRRGHRSRRGLGAQELVRVVAEPREAPFAAEKVRSAFEFHAPLCGRRPNRHPANRVSLRRLCRLGASRSDGIGAVIGCGREHWFPLLLQMRLVPAARDARRLGRRHRFSREGRAPSIFRRWPDIRSARARRT